MKVAKKCVEENIILPDDIVNEIDRYGYKIHLVTYTTTSANMMLREIGLVLFLASVGIKAG